MALQGTLDTFGLPDLLRLMESTGKRGALQVSSQALSGTVWIEDAKIIATDASEAVPAGDHVAVLFKLLCLTEGEFVFASDETPKKPQKRKSVSDVLGQAEAQLIEWRDIQTVIPGMLAVMSLAPKLPVAEITFDADQWRVLASIGAGRSVSTLGSVLELSQVPLCRQLKVLVEMGVATVAEAAKDEVPQVDATSFTTITPEVTGSSAGSALVTDVSPLSTVVEGEGVTPVDPGPTDMADVKPAETSPNPPGVAPENDAVDRLKARVDAVKDAAVVQDPLRDAEAGPTNENAAPAEPGTAEDQGEGLFPTDAEGDEINRGTLLKFLSSVRT